MKTNITSSIISDIFASAPHEYLNDQKALIDFDLYAHGRAAYELLHRYRFAAALELLKQGQNQFESNEHSLANREHFEVTSDRKSDLAIDHRSGRNLQIDFELLRVFVGVSTRLKQPLEWAEFNFVAVFLTNNLSSFLCFEAFGALAEQYYCFNRQDLADRLSVAYLDALRMAALDLNRESVV